MAPARATGGLQLRSRLVLAAEHTPAELGGDGDVDSNGGGDGDGHADSNGGCDGEDVGDGDDGSDGGDDGGDDGDDDGGGGDGDDDTDGDDDGDGDGSDGDDEAACDACDRRHDGISRYCDVCESAMSASQRAPKFTNCRGIGNLDCGHCGDHQGRCFGCRVRCGVICGPVHGRRAESARRGGGDPKGGAAGPGLAAALERTQKPARSCSCCGVSGDIEIFRLTRGGYFSCERCYQDESGRARLCRCKGCGCAARAKLACGLSAYCESGEDPNCYWPI
jgi:hypothetical protein